MSDLLYPLPILARLYITLAFVMIGISGCGGGGGGGSVSVVAISDLYLINSGSVISVSAPGVLQNDIGSGLTAQLVGGPAELTLNLDGSFTYTGGVATSFTYRAVNGTSSATTTVNININQPPNATNACVSTPANTPVSGKLTDTDPDGESLMYSLLTPAGKGTVNLDIAGNFSYTPNNPNLRGLDKFTYQVTDPEGLTATGSAWVIINGAIRIMPLGDSITAGYPGFNITEPFWVGYRRKLYNDLAALSPTKFGIDFVGTVTNLGASANPPLADRDNEGHDGWRDDEIANGTVDPGKQDPGCPTCTITEWLNSTRPDIVLLHIGTNGINDVGGTSSSDVAAILDKIKSWENTNASPVTVFLARIIGSPDSTTNANITTFNTNVANTAQARIDIGYQIVLVNQQTGAGINYQLGSANGSPSGPDMGDNLHPNQDGYDKMADKWKADMLSSGVLPSCP